jgi:hypothetical protein
MISLLKRDLFYTFITNIKFLIYLILILVLYNQFQYYVIFKDIVKGNLIFEFSTNIGVSYEINYFLDILIIILIHTYFLYIAIMLYLKDVKYGQEQIFLRISRLKFIIQKIVNISFITFLVNITIYILLFSLFYIKGYAFNCNLINLLLIDTCIKIILQCFVLIAFQFLGLLGVFMPIFLLTISTIKKIDCLKYIFPSIYIGKMNLYLLITLIFIFIFTIFICNTKIYNLFERKKIYGL